MRRIGAWLGAGVLFAASAWCIGDAGESKGKAGSGRHLVSLVWGCVEVPAEFHSFMVTNLRDAFAGTVAASADAAPFLRWSVGLWDHKSELRQFSPSGPAPGRQEGRSGEGIWRAKRQGDDYLVLHRGMGLLYGQIRAPGEDKDLATTLASYGEGRDKCAGAEPPAEVK